VTAKLDYDATHRNRAPILAVLLRVLPRRGLVLEVASGSGQHAAYLAQRLKPLRWQPSERERALLESIAVWARDAAAEAGPDAAPLPPLWLDATEPDWPLPRADAVVCINMVHIAPWAACLGLVAGAARVLPPGGVLYLYGPFKVDGAHTAPSNAAFDAELRAGDPAWGVRDVAEVAAAAARHGLALDETVAMPANNLSVIFRKRNEA
jgi:SAM-dependent methyltransferase